MTTLEPLIDDVAIIQSLMVAGLPGITIAREVHETFADMLPGVLYDLSGSNDSMVSNGPGLWDVQLIVSVMAHGDSACWDAVKLVDELVCSWDMPGAGWPDVTGGVVRVEREQKFDDVYESRLLDKEVSQADALYRLRMRIVL